MSLRSALVIKQTAPSLISTSALFTASLPSPRACPVLPSQGSSRTSSCVLQHRQLHTWLKFSPTPLISLADTLIRLDDNRSAPFVPTSHRPIQGHGQSRASPKATWASTSWVSSRRTYFTVAVSPWSWCPFRPTTPYTVPRAHCRAGRTLSGCVPFLLFLFDTRIDSLNAWDLTVHRQRTLESRRRSPDFLRSRSGWGNAQRSQVARGDVHRRLSDLHDRRRPYHLLPNQESLPFLRPKPCTS